MKGSLLLEEEENHECEDKRVDVTVFDTRQLRKLEK